MARMRVTFLVSDHGWGHLRRSLVVAAEVVARGHPLQMVVSETQAPAVSAALPAVTITTGALDQGYVFGAGGRGVDAKASRSRLAACAQGPQPTLIRDVREWAPDVVLADATPWASSLARKIAVPSAIASNFSWDLQFAALYAGDEETEDAVRAVQEQVAAFDLALEMPLGPGVPAVRNRHPVPLVGRRPSGGAPFTTDRPIITWAFGGTPPDAQPLDGLRALLDIAAEVGAEVVANESLRDAVPAGSAIRLLPDIVPWPDILAASRLVVSKAGYSTLAEALRGRGHIIAMGVTGLPEEIAMQSEIEARGFGLAIPLTTGKWSTSDLEAIEAAARNLMARPERAPNQDSGEIDIVNALEILAAQ